MVNTLNVNVGGEDKFMVLSYLNLDEIPPLDFVQLSTNSEISRALNSDGFCYDDKSCYWNRSKVSIQEIKFAFENYPGELNSDQINAFCIIKEYMSNIRNDKIKNILL
jgi:hypothetical protein